MAEAEVTSSDVPPVQDEGCCFSGDEIVIVAESGEVFAAPLPSPTTAPASPPTGQ